MCYQLIELYSACRCLYYKHQVDRCPHYPNHEVTQRIIFVGYACAAHNKPKEFDYIYRERSEPTDVPSLEPLLDSDQPDSRSDLKSIDSQFSTVSAASTTTVEGDDVEAAFRRVVVFGDLRYLWPQLVALESPKRSLRTIDSFLKRYAEDLKQLAMTDSSFDSYETMICRTASRFIRQTRLDLAHRIWEAYSPAADDEDHDNISMSHFAEHLAELTAEKPEESMENSNFSYNIAERFLFDTEPIKALESNITAFVRMNIDKEETRILVSTYKSLKISFANIATRVTRLWSLVNQPGSETATVSWTCVSGNHFHIAPGPTSSRPS